MSMLTRAARRIYEKLRSMYYEGPEPPDRLAQIVVDFANSHPKANRKQWVAFAVAIAGDSYRDGYMRGLEWAERDLSRRDPTIDPSEYMKGPSDLKEVPPVRNVYDAGSTVANGEPDASNVDLHEMAYREAYFSENAGKKRARLWL